MSTMDDNDEIAESVISHDSTGKRKSFARLCERFTDKTSLSGVPYIKHAKLRIAKVVWSILLFIAMIAMVVHLWFLIDQYLQWPVITKVKLDFAMLPFPAVTICNTNMMHNGRLAKFPGAKELKILIEKLDPAAEAQRELDALNYSTPAPPTTTVNPFAGWLSGRKRKRRAEPVDGKGPDGRNNSNMHEDEFFAERDRHSQLIRQVREKYMDLSQADRLELGHHMSDMMLNCVYNSHVCSSSYFRLQRSSYYGNCWTMDDKMFKVFNAGPQGGLSIVLYLESTEYIPGLNQGYGIKLHVHEPNTFSFPNDEGIFIPASMETDIGLKQTSITRKPDPYGTCKDSSDFLKKFGRKFTRTSCQAMCKVEHMLEKCGCLNIDQQEVAEAAVPKATPWCHGTNRQCQDEVSHKFQTEKKVDCNCDDPCEEVRYEKTISARQWPMDDYAIVLFAGVCKKNVTTCEKLHGKIDSKNYKNNFLKLNIFYEQLNFKSLTEEAEIENQQFASDVGGAIGLWIGLSMLSLCEVVQLVFELCDYGRHLLWNKRGKKKANNAQSPEHDLQPETENNKIGKGSKLNGIAGKTIQRPSSSQEGSRKTHPAHRSGSGKANGQREDRGLGTVYDQPTDDSGIDIGHSGHYRNSSNPDHNGYNGLGLNNSGPGQNYRRSGQDHTNPDYLLRNSSENNSDYSLYYGRRDPRNNIRL